MKTNLPIEITPPFKFQFSNGFLSIGIIDSTGKRVFDIFADTDEEKQSILDKINDLPSSFNAKVSLSPPCDILRNDTTQLVVRTRGWGWMQYLENGIDISNQLTEFLINQLNKKNNEFTN